MSSAGNSAKTNSQPSNPTESNTMPHITTAEVDIDDHIHQQLTAHARTEVQNQLITGIWCRLIEIKKVPTTDLTVRLSYAWAVVENVVEGIRVVGLVKAEYIDLLFGFAQVALQSIEKTIGLQFPISKIEKGVEIKVGRKVNFTELLQNGGPLTANKRSKSGKEKRPARRDLIYYFLSRLKNAPIDSIEVLNITVEVLKACRGVPYQYRQTSSTLVNLPQVDIKTDSLWEGEMFHYSMLAVTKVAQCLAHRFMQREVKIRGQTVPGTGVASSGLDPNWREWEESTEPPGLPGSSTTPAGRSNLEIMPELPPR